jgi:hypothetical protein
LQHSPVSCHQIDSPLQILQLSEPRAKEGELFSEGRDVSLPLLHRRGDVLHQLEFASFAPLKGTFLC